MVCWGTLSTLGLFERICVSITVIVSSWRWKERIQNAEHSKCGLHCHESNTALPFTCQSSEQSKTLKLPFPTVILEILLDFLYTAQARRVEGTV